MKLKDRAANAKLHSSESKKGMISEELKEVVIEGTEGARPRGRKQK